MLIKMIKILKIIKITVQIQRINIKRQLNLKKSSNKLIILQTIVQDQILILKINHKNNTTITT